SSENADGGMSNESKVGPPTKRARGHTGGGTPEDRRLGNESGASDYSHHIPPYACSELAQKYGTNQGQLHVGPDLSVSYLAMNNEQPLFKGNLALRKAVNYAIDRRALVAQGGFLAGKRSDQILPPLMAGYKDADIYPLKGPNFSFAKKLASGHTGNG